MNTSHSEKKVKRIIWKNCGEPMAGKDTNRNGNSSTSFNDDSEKRHYFDPLQMSAFPRRDSLDGPCMMPLLSIPKVEECNSEASIVLTGTARIGGTGPSVGTVDIGVSKSAYFFRVALPGVKKDPGLFSCEIERDGKVHVRGETSTGERTVSKYSRVFEMKFQQQCPPGPFRLSFRLPGPVDPRLFLPNFRSDGILEAVVAKYERRSSKTIASTTLPEARVSGHRSVSGIPDERGVDKLGNMNVDPQLMPIVAQTRAETGTPSGEGARPPLGLIDIVTDEDMNVDPQLMPIVAQIGTPNGEGATPPLGLIDIVTDEDTYLFRVSLPGVKSDLRNVGCRMRHNGNVYIQGVLNGTASLKDITSMREMKVPQQSKFIISFDLPGPVDPRQATPNFRPDGILEVVVKKFTIPLPGVVPDAKEGGPTGNKRRSSKTLASTEHFEKLTISPTARFPASSTSSSAEEVILDKLGSMNVEESIDPQLKPTVIRTGTAEGGRAGPPVGLVDIGISEDAYLFRVALPGVRSDQCNVECRMQRDGRVHIQGSVNGGAVLKETSSACEMKVQQLCPPGPFTVSFNLPGPIDPRLASSNFRSDGILEVVVRKFTEPRVVPDGVPSS
ncbi:hypothetical protein F0562_026942 [Nyssa sinensis]|uniref:SHSP domain-containing protein n=1 Tax=Nyssa sinensis TaxID=561372 RepID=A0A5J5B874_9ASTE|nr:hypothetical protein F0562_026942 [Nyssa sinensis]